MSRIEVKKKVLGENDRIAATLRDRYRSQRTLCLNLIGSPGAGKTSLLERTLPALPAEARTVVLTGDIETENDARRLARFGRPVKQITTGGACHLDARMVERAMEDWKEEGPNLLLVENVGNLVCPASFDLGEAMKIVVASVAEGDDKPAKYPGTFLKADLVVLNKIDLLPHVSFDVDRFRDCAERVRPGIPLLGVSCVDGRGIDLWMRWLGERLEEVGSGQEADRAGQVAERSSRGAASSAAP